MIDMSLPRALPLLLLAACRAPASAPEAAPAPAPGAGKPALLVPRDPAVLALWPEAFQGAWTVLEVVPNGSAVEAGQVVVRCETRAIDEELHRAELELASAELAHANLLERGRLASEGASAALARARAGLARAERALAGWKQKDLAFARRSDELSKRYEEAGLEDQLDELAQLEKMYQADELVDATEEIVVKRSQRGLALTKDGNALSRERAAHRFELELALQTESREEEFRAQTESVARLEREQALEARTRSDAEARSADALALQKERLARLRRDRALFELTAPSAGILLHGSSEDWRPGRSPARLRRGSQLAPRNELFLLASPAPAAVAFEVSQAELATYADGARLEVHALDGTLAGDALVELDEHAKSLGTGEANHDASAVLSTPLAGARYGQRVRLTPKSTPSPKSAP